LENARFATETTAVRIAITTKTQLEIITRASERKRADETHSGIKKLRG
jgi:hypothetical protein